MARRKNDIDLRDVNWKEVANGLFFIALMLALFFLLPRLLLLW